MLVDALPLALGYWLAALMVWLFAFPSGKQLCSDTARFFRDLAESARTRRRMREAVREDMARRATASGSAVARDLAKRASRSEELADEIARVYLGLLGRIVFAALVLFGLVACFAFSEPEGFLRGVASWGLLIYVVFGTLVLDSLSSRAAQLSTLQHARYESLRAREALAERGQAQAGSLSLASDGAEGGLSMHESTDRPPHSSFVADAELPGR